MEQYKQPLFIPVEFNKEYIKIHEEILNKIFKTMMIPKNLFGENMYLCNDCLMSLGHEYIKSDEEKETICDCCNNIDLCISVRKKDQLYKSNINNYNLDK